MLSWALGLALAQPAANEPGRWYPDVYQARGADPSLSDAEQARAAQLEALGYSARGDGPPGRGVVVREAAAGEGAVLLTHGHRPEAVVITLQGEVLHRWHLPMQHVWPHEPDLLQHTSATHWRRVALLPDGGLLAIHEGIGVVCLDRHSRVRWASRNQAHHDLAVDGDTVWMLTRRTHPRAEGLPVLEDFVAQLDLATGEERRRWSVLEAVQRSAWPQWAQPAADSGDVLHTNSLHLLADGEVLLGSRVHDALLRLDPATGQVSWAATGPWRRQHDAEIGPSGRLWLFDNQGPGGGRSRVLALDPRGGSVLWSWGADEGLFSEVLGAVQELDDGSVLITESTRGRALQVAPDGSVLWDYRSPHVREGQVAALLEAVRLPERPAFLD